MSLWGPLSIPSEDFPPNASNSGDANGMMTVQPNEAIEFATHITLPTVTVKNDADGIGNDVEETFVTSPTDKNTVVRPKSGGLTSAGGARFFVEDENVKRAPGAGPWSLRCLGGKPLRCEGIILMFSPLVSSVKNGDGIGTRIKLAIELKDPETQPNTKRNSVDVNGYISSAWKRPPILPLSRGPRCLRILSPIANMMVTNVTEEFTHGKAVEGTVNRVVLRLTAGKNESCTKVMIRVKCCSSLTNVNGENKQISLKDTDAIIESKDSADMTNPRVRAPVLVKPDASSTTFMTDFGYILPSGWALAGDGQGLDEGFNVLAPTLQAGEETYAYFDVYRPSAEPIRSYAKGNQDITEDAIKLNDCKCETKIDVSIRYNKETRENDTKALHNSGDTDAVSLDHCVTVVWSSPISLSFSSNAKDAYPSGNQHPSNIVADDASTMKESPSDPEKELVLIDNGKVLTKGIISPTICSDGINIEIDKVQFNDTESENTHCQFTLLSGHDDDGTLYKGELGSPCQTLRDGSKISFAWINRVRMDAEYREECLVAPIGTISVHWQPSPINLPDEVLFMKGDSFAEAHGPLKLATSVVCRFSGPLCQIESAPFEAVSATLPESIQVASPFEVTYRIKNKTPVDQELEMLLQDSPSPGNGGFLIGGLVNKRASLGPYESLSFSYTAIPMRVGKVDLPPISISSRRYKTWIVRESWDRRSIFVLP